MTPEQMKEQQDINMRQMALSLAQARVPNGNIDEVLKEAEKVVSWLSKGIQVAS